MAIDVRPVCPADGSECLLEIEQTVDMVLDIERSMRPSRMLIEDDMMGENTDLAQTTLSHVLSHSKTLHATCPSHM